MMNRKKYNILFMLGMLVAINTAAQQEAMFSHYSFNTLSVNPAYAGTRGALTMTGVHRSQWVNFPGAPITQTVSVHAPIFNDKLGVGLSLLNDKIGKSKNSSVFADFSYKLKLGNGQLSFGLKGGISVRSDKLTEIDTDIEDDPLFAQDVQSRIVPNFGAGAYYYTENFYLGISTPQVLENDFSIEGSDQKLNLSERHYYFIAGAMLNLSKNKKIKLKPTTYIKYVAGAPLAIDVTALVYFNNRFWFGPMFRFGDAAGLLIGVNISDQFALSYAYDWSFANSSSRYNAGSHELLLRYDFIFNNKEKIESPRYF